MRTLRVPVLIAAAAVVLTAALPPGTYARPQATRYEVWVMDQADVGRGGAWLYIYDGRRLEDEGPAAPERVNLFVAATGVGDGPGVRPHMVEFTSTHSHAIIANVATGHVYIMRAGERRIVASIDVGEQAHHAVASPDDAYILVANQNGKRLARIRADFAGERFVYQRGDDLDLAALEGAAQPDNAPICPVIAGGRAYVTVRGGGLYVVDYRATPMRVLRAYTRDEIGPAGCGGTVMGERVYINSGSAASSDLYVLDRASGVLLKHVRLAWTGADSHGMVATGGGRFLWLGNRADHNIAVISTSRDVLAGFITAVGAAPDIMGLAPGGRRVYTVLRGPNNLTGGPTARGQTPGMVVLEVADEGRSGRRTAFYPIGDQTPGSPNDPHGLAVRLIKP